MLVDFSTFQQLTGKTQHFKTNHIHNLNKKYVWESYVITTHAIANTAS